MSYIEAKKADKRKRIIEAAILVFSEHGFYNAKVSQIAKRAGVADGTVYLYFNSKDDVLITIFEDAMNQVIEAQTEALELKNTPQEKLVEFARMHAHFVINYEALAALIQLEIRQSNKFMKDYDNRKFADFLNIIADSIQNGIDSGIFTNTNKHLMKQAIFGALDEVATQWLFADKEKRFDLTQAFESYMKVIVKGLLK